MAWIPVPDRVEDRLCAGMTIFYEFIKHANERKNPAQAQKRVLS